MKQQRGISITKAEQEDAEGICQVNIASVRQLCVSDYTSEQIEAWVGKLNPQNHRQAIEKKDETSFVAKNSNNWVLGTGYWVLDTVQIPCACMRKYP